MDTTAPRPTPSAAVMVAFELALGVTAFVVGWSVGFSPWESMRWTSETLADQLSAMAIGVLAAFPVLVVMFSAYRWPIGPLRGLRDLTSQQLMPMFERLSVAEMAAVSLAAGLGEELLFRGLLQSSLASWIGGDVGLWIGLVVASIGFGVCHWLSRTYAVLAACIGAYFGLLLVWSGSLWTPILAHATYDFLALVILTWAESRNREPAENV